MLIPRFLHHSCTFLLSCILLCACSRTPSAEHVIIMGFDAMSSLGLQRAHTPGFNRMIENGALSLHTRCIRETSSSQNWMSMVSASPIEMHGVLTNAWKPGESINVTPALANGLGLYPTIFDMIREQKPEMQQYAFIEWGGETRMYDISAFDSCCVYKSDSDMKEPYDVMRKAFSSYLNDRPELMFLSMDQTDHMGHTYGHESKEYLDCIEKMDSIVDEFVRELERRGWMKNTVIIITADHGGTGHVHGGDSMVEYEIPVIMYGKGVTKGKLMKRTNMIYDVGATAAVLLGVKLPWECRGKLLEEAFMPSDGDRYVPLPFTDPFTGRATGPVSMTVDAPDAEIFYTLDGSEPDRESIPYKGPFVIEKTALVRSVAYLDASRSAVAENWLCPGGFDAPVSYRLYNNLNGLGMPDFQKLGEPSESGYVDSFSLDQLGLSSEDHFAVLFTSRFVSEKGGSYKFVMQSDDGANLYIDGHRVIDNSSAHDIVPAFGTMSLEPGIHDIRVDFYEYSSVQSLSIRYSLDGASYKPLLPSDLKR